MVRRLFPVMMGLLFWGGLFSPLAPLSPAQAQQSAAFIPDKIKWDQTKKDGWFPRLSTGFNFSFSQSDGVVGVPDGTTLSFGLQIDAGLLFASGPHEWRTTLKIIHTQTKLPTLKPFLKSADRAELESAYTYRLPSLKWFGFFTSLKADTSLLPGFLIKDSKTTLLLHKLNGQKPKEVLPAQESFRLTEGFAPFLFKQSLGLELQPYERPFLRVNFKIGVGAVEAWTQQGYRVDDKDDTAELDLQQFQDYVQLGAEAKFLINGKLFSNILSYELSGDVMFPFYTTPASELPFVDLINFEFGLKLGIQLAKWLAIQYKLSLLRTPLIQPKLQITNNLMLSLTADIL